MFTIDIHKDLMLFSKQIKTTTQLIMNSSITYPKVFGMLSYFNRDNSMFQNTSMCAI